MSWVLLFLREEALDRIQLMKALFLFWHRSGRDVPGFFSFQPYLYGPCSFELYRTLDLAESLRLVSQPPEQPDRSAPYFLTASGKKKAEVVAEDTPPDVRKQVNEIVSEVSQLGFVELLRKVYAEAPDFAENSVVDRAR